MIIQILFSAFIVLVAISGDKLLTKTDYFVYKALIDTVTHGSIGVLSWAVIVFSSNTFRIYNFNSCFEVFICGCIATLIDVDHFIAARSLNLQDALHLNSRAPFHSSSLLILIFVAVHILAKVLKVNYLYRLCWIVFVAGGSHHLRDGVRRGLWFPPFGSTPPLHHIVYLGSLVLLPNLVAVFIPSVSVYKKIRYVTV